MWTVILCLLTFSTSFPNPFSFWFRGSLALFFLILHFLSMSIFPIKAVS